MNITDMHSMSDVSPIGAVPFDGPIPHVAVSKRPKSKVLVLAAALFVSVRAMLVGTECVVAELKSIGKSLKGLYNNKARIGLTALALSAPISYTGNVKASEPYLAEGRIRSFIRTPSGYEGNYFVLSLGKEYIEGVEDDTLYDVPPLFGPTWKQVSYVEGKEVSHQRMPAREEPYNVSSSYYIVVPEGDTHTINPGRIYTSSAEVFGFEGWNYEVNEHTVELPAGTYVGPTEIYITGNATVNFTKDLTHPIWNQNPDPNEPPVEPPVEPPIGPVTPVTPTNPSSINPYSRWHKADPIGLSHPKGEFDKKNTLFVYNFVQDISSLPYPQAVALCLDPQNARDFSVFNVPLRQETNLGMDFIIYSNTPQRRSEPVKNVVDTRHLYNPNTFNVKTGFNSFWNNVSVEEGKRNCLLFAYPVSSLENTTTTQRFAGKTPIMTFDTPDSPRWDVHKVIEKRDGVLELLPTKSSYQKGEEIASVNISFDSPLEDVNGDGVVDEKDRAYVFQRLGFEGTSSADIWSEQYGLGIPDGKVTQGDLDAVASAIANP